MIGRSIFHYRILEKLGGGGMGVVYRAEDTRLLRQVALKFLPQDLTDDTEAKARFLQEARAASTLDHPNICAIYEIRESEDDQLFISMAYCPGRTLKHRIADGPLGIDESINMALQAADGMAHAHESGIIHRDIKPANIIISDSGRVKIIDFGLAKLSRGTRITTAGSTVGTLAYMSPEQVRGEEVDQRTDIWSLGAMLYEMVSGQLPFEGDYEAAVIYSILNEEPQPVSELRKNVPPGLEAVIHTCLLKDPAQRYQSAAELLENLDAEGLERVPQRAFASQPRLPRKRKRRAPSLLKSKSFQLIAALLVIILVVTSVWLGSNLLQPGKIIPKEKYLAILPFTNVGNDPVNQAFCDGLMETFCGKITAMERFHDSLWVVPASEIIDQEVTSPGRAKQLFGATLAVTGSVQRNEESVRLTLNLIDTESMRQLGSKVVDKQHVDVINLQDEMVYMLADMLEVELQPEVQNVLTAGNTDNPEAYNYYVQGRGFLQHYQEAQNVSRAIENFSRAITEDPNFALAYAGLGEAYLIKYGSGKEVRWAEEALKNCNHALELNDQLSPVRATLGLVYNATGKYAEAENEFKVALELDPTNANAYGGLADTYFSLNNLEDAEATYLKAISLRPDYWSGYHNLGKFYLKTGRYEEAITQFFKVLELTPENIKAYNNLGFAYHYLGKPAESRRMLERSMEISPNRFAVNNLAVLYDREGRFAEAARMFEKAMAWKDQSDYRAWANLAAAYNKVPEEKDKVKDFYRRAVQLAEEQLNVNPNDPEVLSHLAAYYNELEEQASATDMLEQISGQVEDLDVIMRVAKTWEKLGQRENALEWLKRALERGYSLEKLEEDETFEDLRSDERFQRLITSIHSQK